MSRLRTLSLPIHSPPGQDDSSGCFTPPFRSPASVPFEWEEEPGKPIPCTTLITYSEPISPKKLIPPPRMSRVESKISSIPSPTTFLESNIELGVPGPVLMMMSSKEKKSKKMVGRRPFGSWSWGGRRSYKMGMREGFGGSFVVPSSLSSGFDNGWECCSEYGGESECVVEQVKLGKTKKNRSFLKFPLVNKVLSKQTPNPSLTRSVCF